MSAVLVLEDGSKFPGKGFGADASVSGEVVFNTGMVGYPESLTDPSYRGQILVLTYPLIGNYGVPGDEKDEFGLLKFLESEKIQVSGLIISDYTEQYSHWNARKSLDAWMKENNVPGIYGIDTRMLTKKLREKGVMLGKIVNGKDVKLEDPNLRNLVADASVTEKIVYNQGGSKRIVLVDCGAKLNIIRCLVRKGCEVIRVPWDYDFLKEDFDGILISNGPGDPKMCRETIVNIRKAMERNIPTMGICLGNQLLALAAGGDTYKLKYGHRSQNQPCIEKGTKKCYITTQNHGFSVDTKKLPEGWEEWFINANDGTNEGIRHKTKPFLSFQAHPEATPGPVDAEWIFDRFLEMIKCEMIDVVDENDNVLRKTTRNEVREKALTYRASKIIVKNRKGEYFVQKRSMKKDIFPGMYEVGVGETVESGETYEEAAARGLKEEIGVNAKPIYLFHLTFWHPQDNEQINAYECTTDEKPKFNDGEVEEGAFVSEAGLKNMLAKKQFTQSSREGIRRYFHFRNHKPIDEVDENDNVIGKGSYEEIVEAGKIFRSANILVLNSKGDIFVHKRNRNLPTYGGMWDVKLGGIVDAGETYEEAATRELEEEAGIRNAKLEFIFPLKHRSGKYKNNRKVYMCTYDGKITLQEEEIEEGKFAPVEDAIRMMEEKVLSPSAEAILQEYLKWKK